MFCPLRVPESKETPAAKITPVIKILVSNAYVCSVAQLCLALCSPMNFAAHQTLLFIGLFRQEFWSGLPFPPAGDLPKPGFPASPALAG